MGGSACKALCAKGGLRAQCLDVDLGEDAEPLGRQRLADARARGTL
jgi:hypothetical protein